MENTKMKSRRLTKDSKERDIFVQALMNFTVLKDNMGFTPSDFFNFLDEQKIPAKSKKLVNGVLTPNRRNDFLETTQKAAQDWGILYFYQGKKPNTIYYVDDRTARCKNLSGRRPVTSIIYSGSKRGFVRRMKTKKQHTVENFFDNKVQQNVVVVETADNKNDVTQDKLDNMQMIQGLRLPQSTSEIAFPEVEDFGDINEDETDYELMDDEEQTVVEPSNEEMEEINNVMSKCLNLQNEHISLRKFAFENRFYFVTNFLVQEKYIIKPTPLVLKKIKKQTLLDFRQQLLEKYKNVSESMIEYVKAMFKSFEFPLSISDDEQKLSKYFFHASLFGLKKVPDSAIIEMLKLNMSCINIT